MGSVDSFARARFEILGGCADSKKWTVSVFVVDDLGLALAPYFEIVEYACIAASCATTCAEIPFAGLRDNLGKSYF